jgi:UDP-2-acetamido-3-amino-2,3-dideoxy-glucuronate N-acetyltransferase
MTKRIVESAQIGEGVTIGDGTSVWDLVQIRENAALGTNCVVGRGAYIGPGVQIGDNVKIQNNALVYDPARLGDGVFIGPAAVLTNDVYPRAIDPSGELKDTSGWESQGVEVRKGASIGAGAVVLAGVTVGEWALVAAGATVIQDVPDFALVAGNPAVRKGWVGRSGRRLETAGNSAFRCRDTGDRFEEADGVLRLLA